MLSRRHTSIASRRSLSTSSRPSRRRRLRPAAELVESRTLLSITVDTFTDLVDPSDGFTSLREAIAQAASTPGADTVVVPHAIAAVEGTYSLALGELAIADADPLTIASDGGQATIDAHGASRVFSVGAGSDVTLQGLVIMGGSAPDPVTGTGGGVSSDGTLTVADCTFVGNSAGFCGGGLFNSPTGSADVADSTFDGNSSTYGGGFNNQGTATVTGGTFRNNTATGNSGGVDNIGTVTIQGTLFEANTAVSSGSYGGAINSYGGFVGFPGTTVLEDCTFRNNSSAYVAGAVQISETTGTVTDCLFEGNSAIYGGGLSNSGTTTITGGVFRDNTASGNGAGIESIGTMTIIGTLVEHNTAQNWGGGIHAYGGFAGLPGALTVTGATIRENAAYFGGGISFEEDSATISGTEVSNNTASYGGGVYTRTGTGSIDDSVITGNTAYYGGGLASENSSTIGVTDTSFTSNTGYYGGGGLYDYSGMTTVTGCTFTGNAATYGNGGGISLNYSTGTVTATDLEGNTAYQGGGLYNSGYTLAIGGSTFRDNTANYNGGGIFDAGGISVSLCTFQGNAAVTGNGGGIYLDYYTSGTISSSTFDGNSAVHGGGISAYNSYPLTVVGNSITNSLGEGVYLVSVSSATIGTTDSGNIITGNTGAGVALLGGGLGTSIRGNVINSNGGLAIDLGGDGRTANDAGDPDYGPNYLQNYPVITSFTTGATTRVVGRLNSTPGSTFTFDVYAQAGTASLNPGSSVRYLGTFSVTTDAAGNATFDANLAAATAAGERVSATATDAYGNTSEFSETNFVSVTPTTGLYTSESGTKASFSVVLTSRPTANVTIPLSSSDTTEGTLSRSSLTFTPSNWKVPQTVTVTGVDDHIADGAVPYSIVVGAAVSADALFKGMDGDDVALTNFDNDFAPLASIQPAGSLIYDAVLEGFVASGGTETYSISVDPGQQITVVVDPEGTDLKPTVQLYRGNASVGSATATAAGKDAVLQTIATDGQLGDRNPTTYQIRVTGASKTTGLFHVRIILNAAVEGENVDGPADNTRSTAQSLERSFLSLDGSDCDPWTGSDAARGAVLGRTDASTPDYYAFTLAKGESATMALTGLSSGTLTLALEDSGGVTLAVGRPGSTNLGQVINNFIATRKGTYYLRVTGSNPDGTDYSLVVTRNADLDTEANDSPATAQDLISTEINDRRWVLGAVQPSANYVASAQSYTFEDISTTGHAILQGVDDGSQYLSATDLGGFQFTLYGTLNDSLYVSSNGSLSLPGGFGGTISVMARDLVVYGAADASVYWQVLGTGTQQRLIVQWNDVGFYGFNADPITFEAVLNEADGSIQFNYKDLHTDVPGLDEGLDAAVGIQGFPDGVYTQLYLSTADAPNQYVGTGKSTTISQPSNPDYYRINADAKSTIVIETRTPASQSGQFVNTLDPIVRLYDSSGNLVAVNDNGASDGRNASLSYKVPAGKGGTYYVQVDASPATAVPTRGEYLLSVKKSTGLLPAFQVASTDIPDGLRYRNAPTSIQVNFNDVLLLTTLQAADLKVDGRAATGFTVLDGGTVRFDLPAGLPDGSHTVTIAAGAMTDVQGTKLAAFSLHFTTDTTPPRVIASSIQQGDVLAPGDLTYTVTFSESMSTLWYNFSLVGHLGDYYYPISTAFDPSGTTLTIHYSNLPEDNYTLTLYSGDYAFEDLVGNDLDGEPVAWPIPSNRSGDGVEGGNFFVSFAMDITSIPFPAPLAAVPPAGSLVRNGSASGLVNYAADTDIYTIAVQPGQTLTVLATGLSGLQPTIEIRDHSGTLLASASGTGSQALIQTLAIPAADTYAILVGGAGGSYGAYALAVTVNAAAEVESSGGAANNSVADAQDIDASFLDLLKGATRGAVVGALGDTDVYSLSLQAGQALSAGLFFHEANPPLIFGGRTSYYESSPSSVALGDVNHDGYLDMIDASTYNSSLTVWLGNGDGTFGSPGAFGFGSYYPQQIALADLNGDGDLDVASANYYGDSYGIGGVTVMMGNGDGTFGAAVGYFGNYSNQAIALGDVNGDGHPDIVTTTANDNTARVLENNGDGTFAAGVAYAVGASPGHVALADFNGDGLLDIVTANQNDYSNSATVLLNNGDGTFGVGVPYFTGFNYDTSGVAAGDVNGDGMPDIVLTNYSYNAVSVLLNNGDGSFAPAVSYGVPGSGLSSPALGDVNGDGSLDIVAASQFGGGPTYDNTSVLLNQGDGTFVAAQGFYTGFGTNSVALGDLNGDGHLDLVTANGYDNNLSVLLNQSAPTTLELIAPDGVTVLATAELTDDIQAAFSNFIAPGSGTYYLRVSGPPTGEPYTLVATRDAVFDLGGNDAIATAQPLDPVHVALGYIGLPGDPSDVYSFTAGAGQVLHLFTTTPGDGASESPNTLNPHLRVFDALGNLVAEGVPTSDGRNEDITFTAPAAGTYYVEVTAEDGTAGEYILDPSPVERAIPPQASPAPVGLGSITPAPPVSSETISVATSSLPTAHTVAPSSATASATIGTGARSALATPARLADPGTISSLPFPTRRRPYFSSRGSSRPRDLRITAEMASPSPFPAVNVEGDNVRHGDLHHRDWLIPQSPEEVPASLDEAAVAVTWDECLVDDAWMGSLLDGGQHVMAASIAALGMIPLAERHRRQGPNRSPWTAGPARREWQS